MAERIDPKELKKLLDDVLSNSATYKHLDYSINPCKIALDGVEYYIYIKNITSTAFPNANPEVIRVQLPRRDTFDPIKDSDIPFIFLGYDVDNDVYATWNPYWAKQRLNVVENVSFYSRLSAQKEARNTHSFQRRELSNDGEVITFPRDKIAYYLINIQTFFPEMTEYIALGSKRRTEANEAYRTLTNSKNLPSYARYLALEGLASHTINNYCVAIRNLISNGYFSQNRKIFLSFDSINDYPNAISTFINIPEIQQINDIYHNTYSAALRKYIDFLIKDNIGEHQVLEVNSENQQLPTKDIDFFRADGLSEFSEDESSEKGEVDKDTNWEALFTNDQGKLTRIANPELIDKLSPYLNTEYKATAAAFNIIEDFYGSNYSNMEMKDWQRLLEEINWNNPYYRPNSVKSSGYQSEGKRKTHILKVTYPDGHIIQERMVADTLVEVISKSYPDLINELNIYIAGVNLVSKEYDDRYRKYQREIQDGWLVMTNSSTEKKQEIIRTISDELELGLLVDLVPIEEIPHIQVPPKPYQIGDARAKINVTLPTGEVFYNSKVLYTLIEVVNYAGPENVRALNINVCSGNLVLRADEINPQYERATKPVNDGWYVNTCSDTQTKCMQIQQISDKLGLNLKVELV